ncbi:MAG: hypothetical protein IIY81_02810 [Lachnospiraceae bacterium]|jgi:hypothetical protein|nr:hypothetical protein [Lachnospiraceae bacterium]
MKMDKVVLQGLYWEFQKSELGRATGMKFMFLFNGVEVSAYFDGYDEQMPLLMLILKRNISCAFLSFNVWEFSEKSMEDVILPCEMRECLCQKGNYHAFIARLLRELGTREYVFRNYKADLPFKRLEEKEYESCGIHPFFGGFEPGIMGEKYEQMLYKRLTVSKKLLLQLRERGMTVKTVEKCKERKKLANELAKMQLELEY